jgi:molecular chaperone GrpE
VTSKEPTLADDRRRTLRPNDDPEEKLSAPDPSDPVGDEEDTESRDESDNEKTPEPYEDEDVTIEIIDTSDDEEDEDDEDEAPSRPSPKAVLNRLLEKNEIILKLNKDNAEKDKQLKGLNEKWLRSVAEFENYRKRSRKEWELLKQQSRTEVILEILNIVDDFERAFSVSGDEDDEFVQGIRLIYNNLVSVLGKLGVQEIDVSDSPFDPNFHMAVGQIETDSVDSGHVAEVIQKGYQIDDTVIRPARVIVAK